MPVASFKDIPGLVQDIVSGRKRAITFGLPLETTRQFLMPIKYALSNNTELYSHPLIKPLSILERESPDEIVIVACAAPMELAWETVARYGDFPVINYFTLDYIYGFFSALNNLPTDYRRIKRRSTGRRGILVRGAYMGAQGFQALQKLASDYPDDYIVVSTWETVSDDVKEQLSSVCDCLVLNTLPDTPGVHSYNLQLACIQPGIKALVKAGVERILIARSDYFFADPFMLDGFDNLLTSHPSPTAQDYGQKGRMIVPDLGSRRYIPYHPGDMLVYGWAEDVARFWLSMQEDTRDFPVSIYSTYGEENINHMSQTHPVIETYMGVAFMKHINRPTLWTLQDSLSYFRDFYISTNYIESGMFWFKKMWYNRTAFVGKSAQFISHQLWAAMASGRAIQDFADLNINAAPWENFTSEF